MFDYYIPICRDLTVKMVIKQLLIDEVSNRKEERDKRAQSFKIEKERSG